MTVLRESPWYQEILEEGLQQGLEQGMERGREEGLRLGAQRQLLRVLDRRFGAVPPALHAQLEGLELAQLETLIDAALDAASLDEFLDHLPR